MNTLTQEKVFHVVSGRAYPSFKFKKGIMETLTRSQNLSTLES